MEEDRLGAIIRVQTQIAGAGRSVAELMEVVTLRAQQLLNGSGAVVELLEGDEMVYRATSGSADGTLGLRLSKQGSFSGLCVETGLAMICADSETDDRVDREACRLVGVRSMVVVPLAYEEMPVGVLKVLSREPSTFSESDAEVLWLLAPLVGAEIGKAFVHAETKDRAAQFVYKATHDELTGLPNRSVVFERLRQVLAECGRDACTVGALLVDVDKFKQVNDRWGHRAGDEVLRWVGARLRQSVRREDLVARLGGDEFAIILKPPLNSAALETLRARAERMSTGTVRVDGTSIAVASSVGGALGTAENLQPADLLKLADQSMYAVKSARSRGVGSGPVKPSDEQFRLGKLPSR